MALVEEKGGRNYQRVATAPMPEEGLPTFTFTIPMCSRLQLGLQGNPYDSAVGAVPGG